MGHREDEAQGLRELVGDPAPASGALPSPQQRIAIQGVACRLPGGIEMASFRAEGEHKQLTLRFRLMVQAC